MAGFNIFNKGPKSKLVTKKKKTNGKKKKGKKENVTFGVKIGKGASDAIKERKRKERELLKELMED